MRTSAILHGALRRWGWLLVICAAPLFLLPAPQRAWTLLVLPVILALQWWSWGQALPLTPFNPPLLLLAGMVAISLWAAPDLAFSLPKVSGALFGLLVFFTVARHAQTRAGWRIVAGGFLLAGIGVALLGLVSANWFTQKITLLNPLVAGLPKLLAGLPGAENGIHPNELAGAIIWVLPLAVLALLAFLREREWFVGAPHRDGRLNFRVMLWLSLLSATVLCSAGAWLFAQSRGAYLAIGLTALVTAGWLLPGRLRWPALGLVLLVGLAGLWVGQIAGWETAGSAVIDALPVNDAAFSLNTLSGRLEIWSHAIWTIRDAPLTGIGMNSFREVVHLLYPMLSVPPSFNLGHAHNELLQVALDTGLPGLAAFLALNLVGFGMLVRPLREKGASRFLALGLGGGLLAHFLYGLTDAVALGAKPGFLFWWLLALIFGLNRLAQTPGYPQEQVPA